jgi:hypothetical protein
MSNFCAFSLRGVMCIIIAALAQGFPDSFQILYPVMMTMTRILRNNIGNAYHNSTGPNPNMSVSPPCVAAVAKKTVEKLFSTSDNLADSSCHVGGLGDPVNSLLLQSCLYPDKIIASINRKKYFRSDQPSPKSANARA